MAKKQAAKDPKKKTTAGMIWELVQTLLMAAALYFAIDFCIARVRVENISMETTFTEGELLMVNKLNYKFSEPERGDVVIFEAPTAPGKDYIKRMIGLPGDEVAVKDGQLYINQELIAEEWIHEPIAYSGEWLVPENQYFVLGDNRNHSSDSPLNHIRVVNSKIALQNEQISASNKGN